MLRRENPYPTLRFQGLHMLLKWPQVSYTVGTVLPQWTGCTEISITVSLQLSPKTLVYNNGYLTHWCPKVDVQLNPDELPLEEA